MASTNIASILGGERILGREIRTEYDSGQTAGLLVPSAIVPEEHNLLLNPHHAQFVRVKALPAKPFRFDPRLLTQL